jgi:hypothetical protein
MEPSVDVITSLQASLTLTFASLLSSILAFFPKVLVALLIFIIGAAVAQWVKRLTIRSLEKLRLSKGLDSTPLQSFLSNAEITTKVEVIIANIVYWILILFVLYTSISLLGLGAVSSLLGRILLYIPNVLSAIIILFFGILLAGLGETLVKGAVKTVDGKSARLLGTVTSYLIMIIAVLAAVSELGIAQQFITTLFTGVIAAISIAVGLAFGLGSKDTVAKFMDEWYTKMRRDHKE